MITEIRYNWHQKDGEERFYHAGIRQVDTMTGKVVKEIMEKWETTSILTYEIIFEDNSSLTIYNPNMVFRS